MDKIIYFGDSITEGFEQLKRNSNVVNYGISGDTTIKLIGRVNEVILEKPDKLFINIGINDYLMKQGLYDEKLVISFEMSYKTLIEHLTNNLSDTLFYFVSVLPVVNLGNDRDVFRYNKEIDFMNKFIKLVASRYNATYIDLTKEFKSKRNSLNPEYTIDGLHLSLAGYDKYYELVSKYFSKEV